ncbi:hypothetical protein CCM_00380 [Cordyceps militaris CM01]|uniref:Uncharacterized protein n=1 Tax=Cordyceps militaris (strain CM01) TaxID=983644 RepID=G3J3Q0_CORMM|nr:uncharacterized protein CCM_00380 [Cordyceps militaris CM01]EGX95726.1 hypothetical protein CCM_00380 [Cordyceps militaris CM01]
MALEAREQHAFGMKPDPIQSTRVMTDYDVAFSARNVLGWDTGTMGILRGPSSTWVDLEKYPAETSDKRDRLEHFDLMCQFHRPNAERERAQDTTPHGGLPSTSTAACHQHTEDPQRQAQKSRGVQDEAEPAATG